MTARPLNPLVIDALHRAGADPDACRAALGGVPETEPNRLREAIAPLVSGRVLVSGTLERRLLLVEAVDARSWWVADLSGQPHSTRIWPHWWQTAVTMERPDEVVSRAWISPEGVHRLSRPHVVVAALYHPEHFPLPRFPLGISDLARAVRATLSGQVRLLDMQLGATVPGILAAAEQADVVGVSATFGQHDLLTTLLDSLDQKEQRPLVLAGGSLTARNERLLLERYPWLMVARGAGEPTMADVVAHWHGDLDRHQVRGLGHSRKAAHHTVARRAPTVANRAQAEPFPELDLLGETFRRCGVAQVESSRGCTHFCSTRSGRRRARGRCGRLFWVSLVLLSSTWSTATCGCAVLLWVCRWLWGVLSTLPFRSRGGGM